jgi:opacity protein-like surface antigen
MTPPVTIAMRVWAGVFVSVVIAVLTVAPARAEWFADAHIGVGVTQNDDVKFTTRSFESTATVNYTSSVSPGLRVGRWFTDFPWFGLAVAASYFGPQADLQVIPLSVLMMARYRVMKNEEFPDGMVHLYAALGPGLFISHLDGSLGGRTGSDTSTDIGLDMRLGAMLFVEQNIGLFTEYRFTHVSSAFTLGSGTTATKAETTFNTHHIVVGVSFRF